MPLVIMAPILRSLPAFEKGTPVFLDIFCLRPVRPKSLLQEKSLLDFFLEVPVVVVLVTVVTVVVVVALGFVVVVFFAVRNFKELNRDRLELYTKYLNIINECNDEIRTYNVLVDDYNTAVNRINDNDRKFLDIIDSAQYVIVNGGDAYDETLRGVLEDELLSCSNLDGGSYKNIDHTPTILPDESLTHDRLLKIERAIADAQAYKNSRK